MTHVLPRERSTNASWAVRILVVALGLVVVIAIVAATAPANWLARFLAARTQGRVLLADARGTIWSGNAVLALGSRQVRDEGADEAAEVANAAPDTGERLSLPGRVNWTLEFDSMLAPVLHLTHDGVLLQPLEMRYVPEGVVIGAGAAQLPAAMLRVAGAPLNTLQPEGRCELRWNALHIDERGALIGDGTLRIGALALSVSPVRPLGDYRVAWASSADALTWQLATERGPLELQGGGSVAGRRVQMRVTARAAADASPAVVAQLKTLLDTIGTHGGTEAVIETGSRG